MLISGGMSPKTAQGQVPALFKGFAPFGTKKKEF